MSKTTQNTNSNVSWLKPNQVEKMREAAYGGRNGRRDESIIAVLYDTGLRRGELAQVDRGMVDLHDREMRIPANIQKDYPNDNTPNPATFLLDPEDDLGTVRTLWGYLDSRTDDQAPLFRSQKGGRMTGKAINDVVKSAAKRAGIRPHRYDGRGDPDAVSAHTLRHSVAYRLLHEYGSYTLYDVRNRLRHATILTTERAYDHFQTI